MSEFEKWSLALTAIGHFFVASSIVYAARSWILSEKSMKREIAKDTRSYLSDLDAQIRSYQKELRMVDVNPVEIMERPEIAARLNGLLNIIESVGYEIETDFYDSEMIRKYIEPLSAGAWNI